MKRVMLTVAYDGTNYHGWQLQSNGISIEEVLNRCLTQLLKEPVQVIGASRTDAGVHAWGNIAVFDTQARMPGEKFSYALNQRLPEDIRIRDSREVPADFHPRKTDSIKTYEYRILNEEFPNPVKRLYSHFTYISRWMKKECGKRRFCLWESMISKASAASTPRWNPRCALFTAVMWRGKGRSLSSAFRGRASYIIWYASLRGR